MKNTLGDLNNHLFAQLEKLSDDDLTGDGLEAEIKRAEAMSKVSEQIIKPENCSSKLWYIWMNTVMNVRSLCLKC